MVWSKLSRHQRGYGSEWDKIRKRIMERDCGSCQECKRKGITTRAYAVDHIISKAKALTLRWSASRMNDDSNLQALCKPCHDTKTQEEQGKKIRRRVTIGSDGWPIVRK